MVNVKKLPYLSLIRLIESNEEFFLIFLKSETIMRKFLLLAAPVLLLALNSCKDDNEDQVFHLDVDKTTMAFSKDGGNGEITITSNQKWEITINDDSWLSASVLEGEGDKTVVFTALAYDAPEERSNLVTVKSATITREINVTQVSEPRLAVDKDNLSYDYRGGIEVLTIASNTAWTIVIDENDNWITADVLEGIGDGEVVLNIPLYYGQEDRTATVVVRREIDGDEKSIEVSQRFPVTVGVWILSEGSAMQSIADLAYYDVVNDELKTKLYSQQNGETLGQVANHMVLYGSKLYVAVSGSPDGSTSSIKVIDSANGTLLKTIPMKGEHGEGDVARQMAFHDGKVYVTSYFGGGKGEPGDIYSYYGGVVKIDTLSLSIEAYTRVGDKPEGITYHNGKLLVLNNETGEGKTMSIVDVATFTQTGTVPVPANPVYIRTAPDGGIYVSTLEVYTGENAGQLSGLHKLNPDTYGVTTFEGVRAGRFAITDRYVFTGEFSWTTYEDTANRVDRQTGEVKNIDLDHYFFMIYSFDANPVTGEIYVGGSGDDVIIMNQEGEKLKSLNVGTGYVNCFIPIFE